MFGPPLTASEVVTRMQTIVERYERFGLTHRQAIKATALEHRVDEAKLHALLSSDPLPR